MTTNLIEALVGTIYLNNKPVGSGFILNKEGLICTCAHVVQEKGGEFEFQSLSKENRNALVIKHLDRDFDIAILKIKGNKPKVSDKLTYPHFMSGLNAPSGLWLNLSGYGKTPGFESYSYFSAAGPLIGILERQVNQESVKLLQVELKTVLPGMSGSPLLVSSELGLAVIGILSERFKKDTELTGQSLVIPIDYVNHLADIADVRSWFIPNSENSDDTILESSLCRSLLKTLGTAIRLQDDIKLKTRYNNAKVAFDNFSSTNSGKNVPASIVNELRYLSMECFVDVDFKDLVKITDLLKNAPHVLPDFNREITDHFLKDLVPIKFQEFLMGSDTGDKASSPAHKVNLHRETINERGSIARGNLDYFISKYPVTNYDWWLFTRDTGWAVPSYWMDQKPPKYLLRKPVVAISWGEAVTFCFWLWTKTPYRWRLPTEAEWEYAARGTDGRIFPWGNVFDKNKCNTSEAGINGISDVVDYDQKGTSPFGVSDMAGNIWEWTSSLFQDYPYNDEKTRLDLPDFPQLFFKQRWWDPEEVKISMRGGSFGLNKGYATTYSRIWSSAGNWGMYGGFRLALTGDSHGGFNSDDLSLFYEFELNPFAKDSWRYSFDKKKIAWWTSQDFIVTGCGGGSGITFPWRKKQ